MNIEYGTWRAPKYGKVSLKDVPKFGTLLNQPTLALSIDKYGTTTLWWCPKGCRPIRLDTDWNPGRWEISHLSNGEGLPQKIFVFESPESFLASGLFSEDQWQHKFLFEVALYIVIRSCGRLYIVSRRLSILGRDDDAKYDYPNPESEYSFRSKEKVAEDIISRDKKSWLKKVGIDGYAVLHERL